MDGAKGVMDSSNKAKIPILVGITGHRDIADETELVRHIGDVIKRIIKSYPASPVVLLTPLAEGADRAAAKAVMELRAAIKVSYIVLLPMEEEEYKRTFSCKESVSEYEMLKSQAAGCFTVPVCDSLHIDQIQDTEERYKKLYANMGTYLTLNTQILIAAWNGSEEKDIPLCKVRSQPSESSFTCVSDGARCPNFEIKRGGTYHILRIRFFGAEDEYRGSESYLASREFGPVYWIKTRRKSSDYLAGGAAVLGPVYPDFPVDYSKYDSDAQKEETDDRCRKLVKDYFQGQSEPVNVKNKVSRTYEEILSKLDYYNKDASEMQPGLYIDIEASQSSIATYSYIESGIKKEEVFSFTAQENDLLYRYAATDVLSLHCQKKRKRDVVLLIGLAFAGLLFFSLYSGPLPSNWFILLYSAIYLFGSLIYLYRVKANRYHERYVDYRGIAEGLRVQFFWHLSGIGKRVTDMYLTKQKSSIDWIRIAINNTLLLCEANNNGGDECSKYSDNIHITHKLWLMNQNSFYNKKWPVKDRTERARKKTEKILIILGMILALVLAVVDTYESFYAGTVGIGKMFLPFGGNHDYAILHIWFVFCVGFLPVIIALFRVYTEMLAHSKLARNYKWMRMVYNIALHEYRRIINNHGPDTKVFVGKCRKLFYDVGTEALLENGEWIGIFEERVPEMPR